MTLGVRVMASLALTAVPSVVLAAPSDAAAAAETLFREAKALMAARDFAAACPKLAESQRLDPGTGTLLTLALCHESARKTASAWAEFAEAIAPSRADGRADRIQLATTHAAALESKLVRIRVVVRGDTKDASAISVSRNGIPISPAAYGSAIPVDPGRQFVTVSVHARPVLNRVVEAFQAGVTYPVEIRLDQLTEAAAREETVAVAPARGADDRPTRSSVATPIGYTMGAAGVAVAAVGGVFGVQAILLARDARQACPGDVCSTQAPLDTNARARTDATVANIAISAGAAAIVGGAVLLLVSPKSRGIASHAHLDVERTSATVRVEGTF